MEAQRNGTCLEKGKVTVVIGAQWGDEGKGKMVDYLSAEADVLCRYQGGYNAAHSVVVNGKKSLFCLIPSGLLHPKCVTLLGNGTVLDLDLFLHEIREQEKAGTPNVRERVLISKRAHIAFKFYRDVDRIQEDSRGEDSVGTTRRGIGPAMVSKVNRRGLRIHDLVGDFETFKGKYRTLVNFHKSMHPELDLDIEARIEVYRNIREEIKPMVVDSVTFINKCLREGKKILAEGAQGTHLDIDVGVYPFVTSTNSSAAGVTAGLGIPPSRVGKVFGVTKCYLSRLGKGWFPTEMSGPNEEYIRKLGDEKTQRNHRDHRIGWLDIPMLRHSCMVNGLCGLAVIKIDIFDAFEEIKIGCEYYIKGKKLDAFPVCDEELQQVTVEYITLPGWKSSTRAIKKFSDLPENAANLIRKIERLLEVPVVWIGVGPGREDTIKIF